MFTEIKKVYFFKEKMYKFKKSIFKPIKKCHIDRGMDIHSKQRNIKSDSDSAGKI